MINFMQGCGFCGFLSDPSTGNIFDIEHPCPKCGKKSQRSHTNSPNRNIANFSGPMTVGSNIVAAAKITGLGFCFYYLNKQLEVMPKTPRNESIKKASYFIPVMSAPYVVEILTKEEWPLLGTLFQVGVCGLAIKTALDLKIATAKRR